MWQALVNCGLLLLHLLTPCFVVLLQRVSTQGFFFFFMHTSHKNILKTQVDGNTPQKKLTWLQICIQTFLMSSKLKAKEKENTVAQPSESSFNKPSPLGTCKHDSIMKKHASSLIIQGYIYTNIYIYIKRQFCFLMLKVSCSLVFLPLRRCCNNSHLSSLGQGAKWLRGLGELVQKTKDMPL